MHWQRKPQLHPHCMPGKSRAKPRFFSTNSVVWRAESKYLDALSELVGHSSWHPETKGPTQRAYIDRRYCPPTRYRAFEICPSEQWRTASIITAKTLPLSITA